MGCVLLTLPAVARAERPFAPRFTQNAQGDIALVANTLLSCVGTEPACPGARDGTSVPISGANNNARVMTYVDIDADPATFSSSAATLALPDNGRVLFAGLYWGARLAAGTGGAPAIDPAARGRVLLEAPGDTTYRTVTAPAATDTAGETYQGFADVTSIVRTAGAGEYTVANVQAGTGRGDGQLAGWTLIVAYSDPLAPPRSLAVFDGLQQVGSASPGVTIGLSGFRTPSSGPVRSKVGIVAYEGDRGTTGDGASLQGPAGQPPVALTNALNPTSNVFNSTISVEGTDARTRTPAYPNQLGFDADLLATTGVLGNGQTSTQVRLTTNGDAYQPGAVTIATELFAPRIEATKSVDRASANLGDELTYTTTIRNTGQDVATEVDFDDALPAGVTPLPGTLTVDGVTTPDPTGGPLQLADIAPGGQRIVAFKVRVDDSGIATGTVLENVASVAFTARDLGTRDTIETAPARTRVLVPDVAITKRHTPDFVVGSPSTYSIEVNNAGDAPTSGPVTVTDTLDAGLTIGAVTATGWSCSAPPALVCTRRDPLAPGASYPPITVVITPTLATPTPSNTATVVSTPDGDASNNSATDAGVAQLAVVDLVVTKTTVSKPSQVEFAFVPGEQIVFDIEVTNKGPDTAPEVSIGDVAPPSLVIDRQATGAGYTCSYPPAPVEGTYLECATGSLSPGQSRTLRVVANLATTIPQYKSNSTEVNLGGASALAGDLDYADNTATSTFQTLPVTDTSITKTASPHLAAVGEIVTYTLTVRNAGPAVADTFVADTLPDELLEPEVTISGGTGECSLQPFPGITERPIPQCVIPQMEVGGERVITVRTRVAPGTVGMTLPNRAAVSPTAAEPDFSNNVADDSVVIGQADLVLEKELEGDSTVPAGTEVTYALTLRNQGDRPATGVQLTDEVPAGLAPLDPLPAGCTRAAPGVVCDVGTVEPGGERRFELRMLASATATNLARVSADLPDASPDDLVAEAAPLTVLPTEPGAHADPDTDTYHPRGARPLPAAGHGRVHLCVAAPVRDPAARPPRARRPQRHRPRSRQTRGDHETALRRPLGRPRRPAGKAAGQLHRRAPSHAARRPQAELDALLPDVHLEARAVEQAERPGRALSAPGTAQAQTPAPTSASRAIRAPSRRAAIFCIAISRAKSGEPCLGLTSRLNGENPQSSVAPRRSTGMYFAANNSSSRTCSAVSTSGLSGLITPMKHTCATPLASSREYSPHIR